MLSILKLRESAGEIKDLRVQIRIPLTLSKIVYIADFGYTDMATGEEEFAEAKGFETDVWRIKYRLYKHYGPAKLVIYRGSYKAPFIDEVLIPSLTIPD